ncbi:heparinase II/III domain-containing protein [Butyrivibrio sp. AE2032]|uniref:heparinase II/III domain-containing protein n=1 Tax=Butyrivibrio sp. AE2032 TaxID=1458463 RepID=UPI00068AD3A2|nr:heparinase II/III family protein [Butyrivibrio sp. AE2032]
MAKEISQRHLVLEYFQKTRSLCAFSLCPDISKRDAYDSFPDDLKLKLIAAGENEKEKPWSVILLSDYLEFSKNGNRVRFEELYFSRRRKLNSLIMAEMVENRGRFLEAILDGIYLILEESSWCLPAHNTHVRDAKQQEMPDVLHPIIDLFGAETGALLAFAEYLLRPVLNKKNPDISALINKRLEERIFKPYSEEHFWWMGDGKHPMCNWTPWCTQNVLLCALTRPEGFFSEAEIRKYLESAAISLDYFLDEYGDDGCCNEGAQYYSHAGLCLFGALYLMVDALRGTDFEDIFGEELIRNIAGYIVRMNVSDNRYINFADCAAICPRRTAREYLFGRYCKDEVLTAFAAADFRRESEEGKLLPEEINLFYHVIQAFNYEEMEKYPESDVLCTDAFYESTGLMIGRDETYVLAAKAGNNADSHNHNDVGSFTIYKNGKPLIIDLGVGTYTKQTFSEKRYELWTMQSQFHNVPTFIKNDTEIKISHLGKNPAEDYYDDSIVMQRDGQEFEADKVEFQSGTCDTSDGKPYQRSCLNMDIAGAYKNPLVKNYRRSVELKKGQGVVVTDEYEGEMTALLTLMTYERPYPKSSKDDRLDIKLGDLGQVLVTGGSLEEIQTFPIEDERLKLSWEHEVYRVLIRMGQEHKTTLEIS